jgi:uncharacterized protein involved in exopolysaccharide biosynthesis
MPGRWLLAIARVVFDEAALKYVVTPTIADMRVEFMNAGAKRSARLLARWRGCVAFWTLVLISPFVFSKKQTFSERARILWQIAGSLDMGMVRRLRFVVILFVLGVAGGYFFARSRPVLYTSTAVLQIVPAKVGLGILDQSKFNNPQVLSDRIRSTTATVLSRTRLDHLIKEFNLYEAELRSAPIEDVVSLMRGRISITPNDLGPSASGGQVTVSYTGAEPIQVSKVTERLASLLIEESLKDATRRAEGTSSFIEAEVNDIERQLIEASKRAKGDSEAWQVRRLEIETLEATYKSLLSRRIEASMSVNMQRRQIGEQFVLLDPARVPQRPIGPTRLQMSLLGGAAGIATAVVLAFLAFLYGLTGSRKRLAHGVID